MAKEDPKMKRNERLEEDSREEALFSGGKEIGEAVSKRNWNQSLSLIETSEVRTTESTFKKLR